MSSETAILLRFTAGAAKQILSGNKVNGKLLTMAHPVMTQNRKNDKFNMNFACVLTGTVP